VVAFSLGDSVHRLQIVVWDNPDLGKRAGRKTRGDGDPARQKTASGLHQNGIEMAVIATAEFENPGLSGSALPGSALDNSISSLRETDHGTFSWDERDFGGFRGVDG